MTIVSPKNLIAYLLLPIIETIYSKLSLRDFSLAFRAGF